MNNRLEAIVRKQENILGGFSSEERKIIEEKLQVLSPLCLYVSRDYDMKIELNAKGGGWHWDFEHNIVRVDAGDLLEKPIDYLRFVIQHEAGHRLISRVHGVIPDEVWNQAGFSFMSNAIEDPRDNNFVADNVPKFRSEMNTAYGIDENFEQEMKEKVENKTGKVPRFMSAGFEYIKIWFAESKGEKREIDESLSSDVKEVVRKTLESARKSWNTYPTRKETENGIVYGGKKLNGEETITEYARASFNINFQEVWPLFKTLVDQDIKDTKDKLKKDAKEKGESGQKTESELIDEQAEEIAKEIIKEIEKELNDHFEGEKQKQEEANKQRAEELEQKFGEKKTDDSKKSEEERPKKQARDISKEVEELKKKLEEKNNKERNVYDNLLAELSPVVNKLEDELREIFIKRRNSSWQSGYKSGKRIDVQKEIRSEAGGIDDLNVFKRKEMPLEQDYAIEILIDLSGSMQGEKIEETYKAFIVIAEALKSIGIKLSITGFNDRLHSFKDFDEDYDDNKREKSEEMLSEVKSSRARYNDDGFAVREVSNRLNKREEKIKILLVLSDGEPEPSSAHSDIDLLDVVEKIEQDGKVRIIGLGVGRGTEHVAKFYKENISNVDIHQFAERLANKIKELIEK